MQNINRRQFLRDSALASASVALMGAVRFAAHAESTLTDSRIEVLLDEPLGTISANIYGHFAENLSGVLYDGVWVGTGSKVPNVDGLTSTTSEQEQNVRSKVGSNKKAVFNPKRGLSCARSTKVLIVHNRKVGGSNPPPATMNATAEMQWRSPVL